MRVSSSQTDEILSLKFYLASVGPLGLINIIVRDELADNNALNHHSTAGLTVTQARWDYAGLCGILSL